MKNLGERIKQSIARIEAMQQELDRRLKELEEETANDPFTEGFDYDPDYSPLIDKDAYTM